MQTKRNKIEKTDGLIYGFHHKHFTPASALTRSELADHNKRPTLVGERYKFPGPV